MKAANDIFGTSIKPLKDKTVHKSGYHLLLEIERIPSVVIDHYKNLTLASNIMFVKNIIFLLRSPGKYSLEPQK